MKKIFKKTISLLISITLFSSLCSPVFASDISLSIPVQISETETWFFPTEKDYEAYLNHKQVSGDIMTCGEYSKTSEVSRQTLKHKFVGYHKLTPSWTKSSSYTIAEGVSSSASLKTSYDGISFTLSLTHTASVSTTIPANSKKYSRLGISGDFLVKHMRTDYFDSSGLYNSYNYISKKTLASYIDVKYKS